MKAKEYFKKYYAGFPEFPKLMLVTNTLDACFKEFINETVESANSLKLLRSQVTKFEEAEKKWFALIDLMDAHFKIPENYRRNGDINGNIDVNDIVALAMIFREYVVERYPAIGKEMGKLRVAADRIKREDRPTWGSNPQEALNQLLERKEIFRFLFGPN